MSRSLTLQFAGRDTLEKLRWDILDGVFEAGARLPFALLRTRYGVGMGTLREGLSHLVSEGLIQADVGKGFRVAPVSRPDLLDVAAIRVDFEKKALTQAIQNGSEDWEVGIVTAFHRLEKVEAQPLTERLEDASRWTALHRNFHRALISTCKSPWILHFHSILFDQADRYRLLSLRHRPKGSSREHEHRSIMTATLERDVELACQLAEQHIMLTVEHALRYCPQLS